MTAIKSLVFFILFVIKTIDDVQGVCTLSLQEDFGSPSPVLLRDNEFLLPETNGAISVKRSGTIVIGCPGEKRSIVLGNSTTPYSVLEAHCINNSTFRVDRWLGEFRDIKCNRQPFYNTRDTGRKCYNGAKIYDVGFQIKTKFYQLYEACFDSYLLTTYYVKHLLQPTSWAIQNRERRPNFIEGELFGKLKMWNLYKLDNQNNRLDVTLGLNMSSKYITKKQFLARGHLAARADFTLRAPSRATFHYVNAAPQWQRGNAGDWAALEDALRRRAKSLQNPLTIYTGTHKVLTLEDSKRHMQPIYLYVDANNNNLVPVPLYFYKLVYDPEAKRAAAFISINSSFYNTTTLQQLQFCNDVCEDNRNFSWLKWRSNDGTHSFCCDYEEFVDEVDYLDKLNVLGLFY